MALTELIEEMERQILKEREKESREKVVEAEIQLEYMMKELSGEADN